MEELSVIKLNVEGDETWRYRATLVERTANRIVVEAYFDRQDMNIQGLFIGKGDRFVETYYADRWYNIFEIYARDDGHLRGWYCNITRPATFTSSLIQYIDLALDLVVFPNGRQEVLDEDEFQELKVSEEIKHQARKALEELQDRFASRSSETGWGK